LEVDPIDLHVLGEIEFFAQSLWDFIFRRFSRVILSQNFDSFTLELILHGVKFEFALVLLLLLVTLGALIFLLRLRKVVSVEETIGCLEVETEFAPTLACSLVLLVLELLFPFLLFGHGLLDLDVRVQSRDFCLESVQSSGLELVG
jgi:hypothetical protein